MTKEGVIRVYHEDDPYKPLISTHDPHPLEVNYYSIENDRGQFQYIYYNCRPLNHNEEIIKEVFATKTDVTSLGSQCDQLIVTPNDLLCESFIKVKDIALKPDQHENYITDGSIVVLYIDNARDSSIIFANSSQPDAHNDTVYDLGKH